MANIRDLSIIATPPAKRLAVKTFVHNKNKAIIREAILREILRGGQVYFLHNNVETIEKTAQDLLDIVPEIKVATAHGQMREKQLEHIMADFYHHRINVLVCTTIVESGIDVPSANTMIIDKADHFGLAQLHQLRGRVGRSHHQAYAYLLVNDQKLISKDAQKRLQAIASHDDLGAGFMLATHDLEIRGAGELLGDDQSGQIQAIGFSLYMELLDRAVKSLQAGKTLSVEDSFKAPIEWNVKVPALIPESYVVDVHTRLILYKRIASVTDDSQLKDLQIELIDRFGLLPSATKNLFAFTSLRLFAISQGIAELEAGASQASIRFKDDANIDPAHIIRLIQVKPKQYKLIGSDKVQCFYPNIKNTMEIADTLKTMMVELLNLAK